MKKRSLFVVAAVIALIFIFAFSYEKKEVETDALKFKNEYESLNGTKIEGTDYTVRTLNIPKENPFVYASASDILNKMDSGETFVVYFGFSSCPWCRSVLPTLIEVADELNIETIYYVDVKDIRDVLKVNEDGDVVTEKEGSEGYLGLLARFDNVLDDYVLTHNEEEVNTGRKRIYAPNVVSVVDGEAKELETGISDAQNDEGNPFMELTDDMKKDTYNKFKCSIKCVIENKTVCSSKKPC